MKPGNWKRHLHDAMKHTTDRVLRQWNNEIEESF